MAANNRIYYACQSVSLNGPSGLDDSPENTAFDVIQGLQSVGMNTNFNLEPVYQLGQLSLYDNYEEIPEVEITLNKVLDGYPTLYSMAMGTGSLVSCANHRCGVRLDIGADTKTNLTDSLVQVTCMPSYLSAVTYTFPTEGNFTEEVTIVSNDKVWSYAAAGNATAPQSGAMNNNIGLLRRGLWSTNSTLPTGIGGGLNGSASGGLPIGSRIQNVTVSMNLGRESIFNLGQRTPYYRYVNFPVEITCEIEVIATSGDLVGVNGSSNVACNNPKALTDKEIIIRTCDGMVINLGQKNKLTSVNYQGGDTGGGNATITYSYQTFNDWIYTAPTGLAYTDVVESDSDFPLS
jgi:hypothetical protein